MNTQQVAANIRKLLARHKWSQNELAGRASVSPGWLSKLLNDKMPSPSNTMLQQVADAFGVPLVDLTGELRIGEAYLPPDVWSLVRKAQQLHGDDLAVLDDLSLVLLVRRGRDMSAYQELMRRLGFIFEADGGTEEVGRR